MKSQESQAHQEAQGHLEVTQASQTSHQDPQPQPSLYHPHHHHCDSQEGQEKKQCLAKRVVETLRDINRYLVCDIQKMECYLADEEEARAQQAKQEQEQQGQLKIYELEPAS